MSPALRATATTVLEREHHSAEIVVGTILTIADSLEQQRRIDASLLNELILFLRTLAAQCQTAKEDALLFPALEAKRISSDDASLIENLRNDHRNLVSLTVEVAEAAEAHAAGHDTATRESLTSRLRRLATLYREHLWNEDHIVLPLAEKILSPEELDVLCRAFQRIEGQTSLDEVAARISLHAQRCDCLMGEVFI